MRSIIIATAVALASCSLIAPAMAQDTVPTETPACRTPTDEDNVPRFVVRICGDTWFEIVRVEGQRTLSEVPQLSFEETAALRDRAADRRRYRSGGYYRRPEVRVDCMTNEGAGIRRCAEIRRDERIDRQRESRTCRNPRYRNTSTSCLIIRGYAY